MAKDELDERLEELKRESGGPGSDEERHQREAGDLDAAVAEDFTQEPRAAEAAVVPTAQVDRESAPEAVPIPDEEASERAFREGFGTGSESHMLSFYDRLRERITDTVDRRGGRLGGTATRAL